jgi:hypothetical protein
MLVMLAANLKVWRGSNTIAGTEEGTRTTVAVNLDQLEHV